MRSVLARSAAIVATIVFVGLIAPSLSVSASFGISDRALVSVTKGPVTLAGASLAEDGRWKLGGDGSCYWDPDDSGEDQCSPNLGRWKLGGDGTCYWDPADSGPNQCSPAATETLEASDAKPAKSADVDVAEFRPRT